MAEVPPGAGAGRGRAAAGPPRALFSATGFNTFGERLTVYFDEGNGLGFLLHSNCGEEPLPCGPGRGPFMPLTAPMDEATSTLVTPAKHHDAFQEALRKQGSIDETLWVEFAWCFGQAVVQHGVRACGARAGAASTTSPASPGGGEADAASTPLHARGAEAEASPPKHLQPAQLRRRPEERQDGRPEGPGKRGPQRERSPRGDAEQQPEKRRRLRRRGQATEREPPEKPPEKRPEPRPERRPGRQPEEEPEQEPEREGEREQQLQLVALAPPEEAPGKLSGALALKSAGGRGAGRGRGQRLDALMLRGLRCVEVPIEEVAAAGSCGGSEVSSSGRPKRHRVPPLETWRNERLEYQRLPGSATPSIKRVIRNEAGRC